MGAISADFGAREHYLKTKVLFHLAAQLLQGLPEKFFDLSATQTDDVSVFGLESRFVVMLIAAVMHQVELIDESTLFEHLQGAVDGDAVEFGVFLFGKFEERVGIEVFARFVDQFKKDFPLTCEPDALQFERIFDAGDSHCPLSVTLLALGQARQCVAGDTKDGPLTEGLCAEALVEADSGFVPIENRPFEASTIAFYTELG